MSKTLGASGGRHHASIFKNCADPWRPLRFSELSAVSGFDNVSIYSTGARGARNSESGLTQCCQSARKGCSSPPRCHQTRTCFHTGSDNQYLPAHYQKQHGRLQQQKSINKTIHTIWHDHSTAVPLDYFAPGPNDWRAGYPSTRLFSLNVRS